MANPSFHQTPCKRCSMSRIILLGAGASFGSDTSGVPPLGVALFDELRRFNPDAWGKIEGQMADRFREDFEEAVKAINPSILGPLQRAMAAYFFEFRPQSSSLYVQLSTRIKAARWSGSACTLNYERLFEISLISAGIRPVVGKPTTPGSTIELCLPHGCCHIFCDAARGAPGAVRFNAFAVRTDGPVKVIVDPSEHRRRIITDAFPPVMSYFEPQKRTTAGHSFIEGQRRRWTELASSAETICVVGIKVRPHDTHVWEALAKTSGRIVYCAGPSAADEYRAWAAMVGRNDRDLLLPGYFRDEFNRICTELSL